MSLVLARLLWLMAEKSCNGVTQLLVHNPVVKTLQEELGTGAP